MYRAKRLLRFAWRCLISILELIFDVLWTIHTWACKDADDFLKRHDLLPKESPKAKKSAEWEDSVAIHSKVPHQGAKTNEAGKQIKIKINGVDY